MDAVITPMASDERVSRFDATEGLDTAWPLAKRAWRKTISFVCCFPDTGLFGLTPLRKHIVICGYPRTGSTMLQLMLEHAYPQARCFTREVPGHKAAMMKLRNHALLISKQPGDIFRLHQLQNHYAGKRAELRPIVMIRDPRDVLTSHHSNQPGREYFLDVDKWASYDDFVRRHERSGDVFLLKYEELVADVDGMQKRLETFVGEPISAPISRFHTAVPANFRDLPALNGLRSVDANGVGRWRDPRHRQRIQQVLESLPTFARRLIALGYERDESWTRAYRRDQVESREWRVAS